ncbi:mechanosensitive ion channel [Lentisphaera profundi]|uniref:Mechanosensitive ion channel n=1 Tax=Lentisphaera profundi TaxID=1658616 RepID=A0ABY7VVW3_9BACT|nr:mechanosensitive ion channel domain-containing protein [Lentisphaera profundi]WDE98355.1 mechanosensitive ion channel [Lentisphaera profundi]
MNIDPIIFDKLIKTLIVLLLSLVLRFLIQKQICRSSLKSAALRQRWTIQLRNACFFIFLFCLLVIWGEQIQNLLISLLAVLAAIVLATKELILCLMGSVLKAGTNSFSLGDRISVGEYKGLVVDQTLLSTTLYDTGTSENNDFFTGKTIVIPNSLFLAVGVINENNTATYKLYTLEIKLSKIKHLKTIENGLREKMDKLATQDIDSAFESIKKQFSVGELTKEMCEPKIVIIDYDGKMVKLLLRFIIETNKAPDIDQELLRFHFDQLEELGLLGQDEQE